MKKYTQQDVDEWCRKNGEEDATNLFNEMLPKHKVKLDRLDKRIRKVLAVKSCLTTGIVQAVFAAQLCR